MNDKQLFKRDHETHRSTSLTLVEVAKNFACMAAEFERRNMIDPNRGDADLAQRYRDIITALREGEDKTGTGSEVDRILAKKEKEAPGFWARFFGKRKQVTAPVSAPLGVKVEEGVAT